MELPGVGFDIGSENARMGFPLGDDRTLMSTSPVPSCTVCLEMFINQNSKEVSHQVVLMSNLSAKTFTLMITFFSDRIIASTSSKVLEKEEMRVKLTWLGQAGFYLISENGVRIMIDPYLSDSLYVKNGESHRRLVPINEEYLNTGVDVLILTHAHGDHTDFGTLDRIFEKNPDVTVLSARNVQALLRERYGTGEGWMLFEPDTEVTIKGLRFRATFAMHSDPCPIGVVIEENGRFYCHTGDTMYHRRLTEDYPSQAELLMIPINGKGNNMNAADAARLTDILKPKRVFPMHWDLFERYSGDPEEFTAFLKTGETEILRYPQYQDIYL